MNFYRLQYIYLLQIFCQLIYLLGIYVQKNKSRSVLSHQLSLCTLQLCLGNFTFHRSELWRHAP